MRVQFILKKNEIYSFVSYCRRSSGLWNSTQFVAKALAAKGVHVDIVEVHDNNDIDREVRRFKPNLCIIEALWVVPEKFDVLKPLHPKVKWFVHMHSGLPFLALEGIAMGWLKGYTDREVGVIANSEETDQAFRAILPGEFVSYLPNVYLPNLRRSVAGRKRHDTIHVGCFGALRPMKNHLLQAIAAIKYANKIGKCLHFYINGSRIETGGEPVLKNLKQLFKGRHPHKLIMVDWLEPEAFVEFLHFEIDIGMQVSMTETFNVVTADYVSAGVPIVVSKEVTWASGFSKVDMDTVDAIVLKMGKVHDSSWYVRWNQYLLQKNSNRAADLWHEWVLDNDDDHFQMRHLRHGD